MSSPDMSTGSNLVNGHGQRTQKSSFETKGHGRSQETTTLLQSILPQLTAYIAKADAETDLHQQNKAVLPGRSSLIPSESLIPEALTSKLSSTLLLPDSGSGKDGFLETLDDILQHSVNVFSPGFMDKLYGSPLAPGIAAELVLAILNTNLHVYQVSPALTLIEKHVTKRLAAMFGLNGPRAGGISVQGGSASNMTSIVAARNSLFPKTKTRGNVAENGGRLTLFTSAHGHYSIEKAAQALGFGSQNVVAVPVDGQGRMLPEQLDRLIIKSKKNGYIPFYINATAGSTVLGSFDPFDEIAAVAKNHHCWLHVDGAWGGGFVFANRDELKGRLKGIGTADSIAVNPHKMLGSPMTCSFLLTRDLKLFQTAMTLKAGYLFHDTEVDQDLAQSATNGENGEVDDVAGPEGHSDSIPFDSRDDTSPWSEPYDLADLTLQCGRRGDSLKLFMSWQYYGTEGYRTKVENAYDIAVEFATLIDNAEDFTLVLGKGSRPECLQVCFYYTPGGKLVFGPDEHGGRFLAPDVAKISSSLTNEVDRRKALSGKFNSLVTSKMSRALIERGFMVDFAPALEGQEEKGSFFRVVVNISTIRETVYRLTDELRKVGVSVVEELQQKYHLECHGI